MQRKLNPVSWLRALVSPRGFLQECREEKVGYRSILLNWTYFFIAIILAVFAPQFINSRVLEGLRLEGLAVFASSFVAFAFFCVTGFFLKVDIMRTFYAFFSIRAENESYLYSISLLPLLLITTVILSWMFIVLVGFENMTDIDMMDLNVQTPYINSAYNLLVQEQMLMLIALTIAHIIYLIYFIFATKTVFGVRTRYALAGSLGAFMIYELVWLVVLPIVQDAGLVASSFSMAAIFAIILGWKYLSKKREGMGLVSSAFIFYLLIMISMFLISMPKEDVDSLYWEQYSRPFGTYEQTTYENGHIILFFQNKMSVDLKLRELRLTNEKNQYHRVFEPKIIFGPWEENQVLIEIGEFDCSKNDRYRVWMEIETDDRGILTHISKRDIEVECR